MVSYFDLRFDLYFFNYEWGWICFYMLGIFNLTVFACLKTLENWVPDSFEALTNVFWLVQSFQLFSKLILLSFKE